MARKFNPNSTSFAKGLEYIKAKSSDIGFKLGDQIVTSRDPGMDKVPDALKANASARIDGFRKWALPVYFLDPVQTYFSYSGPDTDVPEHSHDEGDGLRIILSGSIIYRNKELVTGDWMYIPKGASYSFKVGATGVGMFYCYSCCCGGW